MANKIFHSIMSVAIAVLLAGVVIITGALYSYFGTTQQTQLRDELRMAAGAAQHLGEEYLSGLDFARYRLTWVDPAGNVLFDSHADARTMENHGNREEIREALTQGTGSSVRQSSTLTEQTIYEATRLEDGSVLRISVSHKTAWVLALGMLQPILLVLILAIALSAWLSHRMAKRVVEPLNRVDLDFPMENDVYEELTPLLHRIHAQHQEIELQMRTLKRKQDEFDQITCSMKEALILLDHMGRIVSINPAARALFGPDASYVGDDFLTVDREVDMRKGINTAMTQGEAHFRSKKNGREYQFDLSRIDSEGKVRGLVMLAFDITEQVNAEQNRREFTANVSHELKTPLQSIIGSAELMENGIVKPEDMPKFLGRIRKEGSRLVSLIDDIIRLSQLDEGAEMPREEVSLRSLALEARETLADAAAAKDVTVTLSGEDGVMTGVRRLLYEVVYNLCDNAIKYNRPGGEVGVSIETRGDTLALEVRDTGIGIAPEHHDKVFERFYRVDKSHSRQSGGTGLGLSIVKHAVQYHGGRIEIQSAPGEGTAITVLFEGAARAQEGTAVSSL